MRSAKTKTTKRAPRPRPQTPPSPDAELDPPPDPESVAADILGGEGPKTSTERVREHRRRKREAENAPEPEPVATAPVGDEDTAGLVSVLWETVCVPLAGRWKDGTPRLLPLNDSQALRMGSAYSKLVNKWAPMLGAWQPELAALIVTVAVIRECATPKPEVIDWTPPSVMRDQPMHDGGDDAALAPETSAAAAG